MKGKDLKSLKQNPEQLKQMASEIDPGTLRMVQKAVSQYQGKDEDQLLNELTRLAAQERARGSLSNERLDSIASMIAPMLSPEQQQVMTKIKEQLKEN